MLRQFLDNYSQIVSIYCLLSFSFTKAENYLNRIETLIQRIISKYICIKSTLMSGAK